MRIDREGEREIDRTKLGQGPGFGTCDGLNRKAWEWSYVDIVKDARWKACVVWLKPSI